MKKYLVKYHGFSNVYTLVYADTPELLADALTRLFTPDAPDGNAPAAANGRGA